MLDRISRLLALVDRALVFTARVISGSAFALMAAIAFVDAISRQLRISVVGSAEYVQLGLMTLFFAAIALVVRDDQQIRIGILADLYKPRLAMLERYFTGIAEVLALILLAYLLFDMSGRTRAMLEVTRIPLAPWIYAAGWMSLIAIWFALRNLGRIHKAVVPRPHALPDEEK